MPKKLTSLIIVFCFFLTTLGPLPKAHASTALDLPAPGTMVNLSPAYEPVIIKGLTVHKDNPFLFDFIVDVGQDRMSGEPLKKEGEKLIKYFLASLAIPDKDVWVNLSPYEKDRMIPEALGQTDMGRDLLEQDYILKQITASLIYPEKDLGRKFWNEVYSKAQAMYGTTQIPVNTFNKVWIMADRAEVFEHNQTAFVVDQHLKVMLEEDYLALQKHSGVNSSSSVNPESSTVIPGAPTVIPGAPTVIPGASTVIPGASTVIPAKAGIHSLGSQVVKEIILPQLEKEVNTGKNFANLRQIFNSIILSSWYKKNLQQALLNQVYADKSKVKGIDLNDPTVKERIYEEYLKAYKKGVFNYIKEESVIARSPKGDEAISTLPRKYFSGGINPAKAANPAMTTDPTTLRVLEGRKLVDLRTGFKTGELANLPPRSPELSKARSAYLDQVKKNDWDMVEWTSWTVSYKRWQLVLAMMQAGLIRLDAYRRFLQDLRDLHIKPKNLELERKAFLKDWYSVATGNTRLDADTIRRARDLSLRINILLRDFIRAYPYSRGDFQSYVLKRITSVSSVMQSNANAAMVTQDNDENPALDLETAEAIKLILKGPNRDYIEGETVGWETDADLYELLAQRLNIKGRVLEVGPGANSFPRKGLVKSGVKDVFPLGFGYYRGDLLGFDKITDRDTGEVLFVGNDRPGWEGIDAGGFESFLDPGEQPFQAVVFNYSLTDILANPRPILQDPFSWLNIKNFSYQNFPFIRRSRAKRTFQHAFDAIEKGGWIIITNFYGPNRLKWRGRFTLQARELIPAILKDSGFKRVQIVENALTDENGFALIIAQKPVTKAAMMAKVDILQESRQILGPEGWRAVQRIQKDRNKGQLNALLIFASMGDRFGSFVEGRTVDEMYADLLAKPGGSQIALLLSTDEQGFGKSSKGDVVRASGQAIRLAIRLKELKLDLTTGRVKDAAMVTEAKAIKAVPANPGGIDLATNGLSWKVRKDGNGVEMNIDPAMIEKFKREGIGSLSPVILRITPVASIWPLLGMKEPEDHVQLAKV